MNCLKFLNVDLLSLRNKSNVLNLKENFFFLIFLGLISYIKKIETKIFEELNRMRND